MLLQNADAGDRILRLEIDYMSCGADSRCLFAGNASIAEVVQLKIDQRRSGDGVTYRVSA